MSETGEGKAKPKSQGVFPRALSSCFVATIVCIHSLGYEAQRRPAVYQVLAKLNLVGFLFVCFVIPKFLWK